MSKLARIALALASWFVVNGVSYQVLVHNQKSGVYSPEADTIAIPFVENGAISLVLVLLLAASILCSRKSIAVTLAGIVFGVLGCVLAGFWALQWFVPGHYLIAVAFGALAAASA